MFSSLPSRIAAAIAGCRAPISRGALLRGGLVAAALGVSACTTPHVLSLRPDVDVGTQTAAVPSGGGLRDLVPDDPYLQQAEADQSAEPGQPAMDQQAEVDQPVIDPPQMEQPAGMDQPAAEAQVAAALPPGSGLPLAVVPPTEADAPDINPPVEMSEPVEPQETLRPVLAAYPRMDEPAGPAPMPSDEAACRRELKRLGVTWRELSPINEGGSCRIAHPIKVSVLPGGVGLKPAATLNCEMALTFAKWTKKELNPAARMRYWSRVKTIHQASSYSCRRINRSRTMSEHSKGNALDVSRIELASGRDIDVRKPGLFAFRTRGFLNNVRADGCEYFTTVLGPGYNRDHRDHFHFDIKPRRNGRVACH